MGKRMRFEDIREQVNTENENTHNECGCSDSGGDDDHDGGQPPTVRGQIDERRMSCQLHGKSMSANNGQCNWWIRWIWQMDTHLDENMTHTQNKLTFFIKLFALILYKQ